MRRRVQAVVALGSPGSRAVLGIVLLAMSGPVTRQVRAVPANAPLRTEDGDQPPSGASGSILAEIARNERKWKEKRISSYTLAVQYQWASHLLTEYAVTVVRGRVTESSSRSSGNMASREEPAFDVSHWTVPGLFEQVRQHAKTAGLERFSVTFDSDLGIPRWWTRDAGPHVMDGYSAWRVTRFSVGPAPEGRH